ncbi:MAG: hypothetical protein VW891_16255, partial [Novosphingobium sp.]
PALGLGLRDLAASLSLPVICSLIMGAIVWTADRLLFGQALAALPGVHLVALVGIGVVSYAGALHVMDRTALVQVWQMVRRKPLVEAAA